MTELADFLLQRLAEDEAVAHAAYVSPWTTDARGVNDGMVWMTDAVDDDGPTAYVNGGVYLNMAAAADHIARHDPARVLAEVAAKRAVVEQCAKWAGECLKDDWGDGDVVDAVAADMGRWLMLKLAMVHASHPDYRHEWRP